MYKQEENRASSLGKLFVVSCLISVRERKKDNLLVYPFFVPLVILSEPARPRQYLLLTCRGKPNVPENGKN